MPTAFDFDTGRGRGSGSPPTKRPGPHLTTARRVVCRSVGTAMMIQEGGREEGEMGEGEKEEEKGRRRRKRGGEEGEEEKKREGAQEWREGEYFDTTIKW